jgi:uncharacterized protein YjbJ (UPF0337 family)
MRFLARGEAGRSLAECRNSNHYRGGSKMKRSTKNEIAGKVKEKVGQLTNDPELEGEGIGEKIAGKVQQKTGQLQKVFEKP